jgi:hypothetical protein
LPQIERMRYLFLLSSLIVMLGFSYEISQERTIAFDHAAISFHGRFDFSNKSAPKVWAPGAYVQFAFSGSDCSITVIDEMKYGNHHNYIHVVIDGVAKRMKLTGKFNRIAIAANLSDTIHQVTICKDTESAIGFIQFHEIICDKIVPITDKKQSIIEFIGDSITCGNGSDLSLSDCTTADWYDQHNAYDAYGPTIARTLGMNYLLSSVSGIGLTRSCCGTAYTLPDVYHAIDFNPMGEKWESSSQKPQIICITLGQNDGLQDENVFVERYCSFIKRLKMDNPMAKIVCCSSPMATEKLSDFHAQVLPKITQYFTNMNDTTVCCFLFKEHYRGGCDSHPTIQEHKLIANQLTAFLKELL